MSARTPEKSKIDNLLTSSYIWHVMGRNTDGDRTRAGVEPMTLGKLSPAAALMLFLNVTEIFGLIAGRVLAFSGIGWTIETEKQNEDLLAEQMRDDAARFREFIASGEPRRIGQAYVIWLRLASRLGDDLFRNLSNFDAALVRWSNAIRRADSGRISEIQGYFEEPVKDLVTYPDYAKAWALDMLVHGAAATYLIPGESVPLSGWQTLPGGSTYPLPRPAASSPGGYVQLPYFAGELLYTRETSPTVYSPQELIYAYYLPINWQAPGLRPLDAVINQALTLMRGTGLLMDRADGTRPPEKAIIFGKDPVGLDPLDNGPDAEIDPVSGAERERLETILNDPIKDALIRVLTGVGRPIEVDLSKAEMMPALLQGFQEVIKPALAIALGATMSELQDLDNGAVGRSVSEAQERLVHSKGINPLVKTFETEHNLMLRRYWGPYVIKLQPTRSDAEKITMARDAAGIPGLSRNEIRTRYLGIPATDKPGMDDPLDGIPQTDNDRIMSGMDALLDRKLAGMGLERTDDKRIVQIG